MGEDWYSEPDNDDELISLVGSDDEMRAEPEWDERTDMRKFEMKVGLKFPTRDAFMQVLKDWAVRKGFDMKFKKIEKKLVTCTCKSGCDWHLRASVFRKTTTFQVKSMGGKHSCAHVQDNKQADYKYIGQRIVETVKDNPNAGLEFLKKVILKECQIECSVHKVYRAKRYALSLLKVDLKEQFNRLYDYCATVCKYNPSSSLFVKVNRDVNPPKFQRMYVCLAALKKGFLSGCRPIIGLDGCFVKGIYKGQLLSAAGKDGNDNMYPIAIAYVEIAKQDSWEWFISLLLKDLGEPDTKNLSFISGRQKGLIEAIHNLAPESEHRFCLRHMYNNFKAKFKGLELKKLFGRVASTYNVKQHMQVMTEIKRVYPKRGDELTPYEWLTNIPTKHWARCFFPTSSKCDVIVNNISESFNSYILDARELSIVDMFEAIRKKLMTRIQVKATGMKKYTSEICPNTLKKLDKVTQESRFCFPSWVGDDKFEVMHHLENHIVYMNERHCSCGMFQICGYPCAHALACIGLHRLKVEDYVHGFFKKDMYLRVYSHMVNPVPGVHDYEYSGLGEIDPPDAHVSRGRPKKRRIRDGNDIHKRNVASRKGLIHTCSICQRDDHNKRKCRKRRDSQQQLEEPSNSHFFTPQPAESNQQQLEEPSNLRFPTPQPAESNQSVIAKPSRSIKQTNPKNKYHQPL